MKQRLTDAIGAAPSGYVEIRLRRRWTSTLLIRRRRLELCTTADELGGLVRCLAPGHGWGAVTVSGPGRPRAAVQRAHELSLDSRRAQPITLAPIPIRQLDAGSDPPDDPRAVPLVEKRRLLEAFTAELLGADRRLVDTRTRYADAVVETWLLTSEGSWLHEVRPEVSLAALAVAEEDGTEERALVSWAQRGGWHAVAAREGLFRAAAQRAVERLHAPPVRPGRYPVVLDPRAAGVLVHRAVAHLCRAPGEGRESDALPVGTRLGPECLTVGDDPTAAGLRATLALDDEGTPAANTVLVRNGVVVAHLETRATAAREGRAPTGHALAASLRAEPAARATNSYLASGRGTLDDLLSGIGLGVYLGDALAAELDGGRLALLGGYARLIRGGRLAEPVRCPPIGGDLLAFFGQLDAVASDFSWDTSESACTDGTAAAIPITTGAPHARFLDLPVGLELG